MEQERAWQVKIGNWRQVARGAGGPKNLQSSSPRPFLYARVRDLSRPALAPSRLRTAAVCSCARREQAPMGIRVPFYSLEVCPRFVAEKFGSEER